MTFYLCDGKVESCSKNECYIFGGECRHTQNIKNAVNPPENKKEVLDDLEEFMKY